MLVQMALPIPSPRLLVVDDEPMICEVLCAFLQEHGFECQICGSADEALAELGKASYDLVISDYQMPGRSGMDLLQAASQLYPQTAFLMVTAASDAQTAVEAMRHGAANYLVKPLELKQVLAAVQQALERQQQRTQAERSRIEVERLLWERTRQLGNALQQVRQSSAETLQALAM